MRPPPAQTTGRKKVSKRVSALGRSVYCQFACGLLNFTPLFSHSKSSHLLWAMSSFFTVPASQRKRKREDRAAAPASKKRGVDAKGDATGRSGGKRRDQDEESISGSDIDEDNLSVASGVSDDSGSESDEGETAADRRLKLAERYLENVRDEVDDIGFDAAEIDRDLIAERLKEDVVRIAILVFHLLNGAHTRARTSSKDASTARLHQTSPFRKLRIHFSEQIHSRPLRSQLTRPTSIPCQRIGP